MLFSIDIDAGNHIVGWIMPDNPTATPRVVVFIDGEMRKVVEATILRPLLREQGLHDTGICGFVVDENNVPGLTAAKDVEVYDEATNIRIFRRRPAEATLNAKLFRLETSLVPQVALNEALQTPFHMIFTRLERVPEEAARSIIGIPFTESILCSGRLHLPNYDPLLRDRGFKSCIVLREPVEELAEQLLVLRWATKAAELAGTGILNESYQPMLRSLTAADIGDVEAFEPWLKSLSALDRFPLTNQLTRLLTCRAPEDGLEDVAVGNALDILSDMEVVGLRTDLGFFWARLGAALSADLPEVPRLGASDKVNDLAAQIRGWPIVQQMLAADLELFADVAKAFERAFSSGSAA